MKSIIKQNGYFQLNTLKFNDVAFVYRKKFSSTKGGNYKYSRKGGFKRSKIRKWNLHVLMNCFDPMVGGRSPSLLYNKNMIPNTTLYLKKYVYQIFLNSRISFYVSPMIDFIDISIIGNQYTSLNCKHSIIVDLAVAFNC